MSEQKFKVSNESGMWVRTEPVVSEATEKELLPKGQLVTKIADTDKPNWWKVRTTIEGVEIEGFSNKTLMVPDGQPIETGSVSELIAKALAALSHIAPSAKAVYLDAIRNGTSLFETHNVTTPLRMAHFLAQALQETGSLKVRRESMSYSVPRMLEIFGVGNHSAKVTSAEAPGLAHNEPKLSERVYGLGNPGKAAELGNTEQGDGFRYRGNGFFQTTGRGAHRRIGLACGLDFEGNPDLITLTEHALKPALQEWTENNLNHFADNNDIRTITKRINGGLIGFDERKAFFAQLLPRLKAGG